MKKVLLVTRVSGFIPQHEMKHVRILQDMGYEVHYASDFNNVVYGKDNHRLDGTGVIRHQIDFVKSPFSRQVKKSYLQLVKLLMEEEFAMIHCHMPMSGVVGRLAAQKVYRQTGRHVPVLYTAPWSAFLYRSAASQLAVLSGGVLFGTLYGSADRHQSRRL